MNVTRRPKLTIGMATFDDFDGVYFTITSLMIHHPEAMEDCDILVVDNNPSSKLGRAVKQWVAGNVPNGAYVPFNGASGTAQARNEVFRRAQASAVLCLDCHVLLVPGAVLRLIEYHAAHPDGRDLLTGPLLTDAGKLAATHQRPQWSSGTWGVWSKDQRGADPEREPFEIWQQGMGLFSCRKEAWVGFHPEFRGFGGCESYVMEKVRRRGGRVLCCPWLRWTHRFPRPNGVPYRVDRRETFRNYLIGFQELGLDLAPVERHFRQFHVSERDDSRTLPQPAAQFPAAQFPAAQFPAAQFPAAQFPAAQFPAAQFPAAQFPAAMSRDYVVIGEPTFGGVRMRGRMLAHHLCCASITPQQAQTMRRTHTIVAIKTGSRSADIRKKCERLVYDPLDVFADGCGGDEPAGYWLRKYRELAFDDIIATSPACYQTMREALPEACRVHMVPHQCDRSIKESWRNPAGPIAYSGLGCFVESGLNRIKEACRMLGKEFVAGRNCDVLQQASLALALRLPPYDTPLNRRCKPQIKLENAAAAGLPAVTTDCPAAASLRPRASAIPVDFSPAQLAGAMRRALAGPGLCGAFRDQQFLAAMDRVLGRPAIVVYTAVFGEYDVLRTPRERQPGVQYVCFSDNPRLKSDFWDVQYHPSIGDPMMQAKRLKILAHQAIDCDWSIWIDGRIELHGLNGVIGQCKTELALVRHPHRHCIYAEAEHCRRIKRGAPDRIEAAIARYRAEGHPKDFGLWRGGVLVRKHTEATARFNREWWKEVSEGTTRDQISLPVVLRRLATPFETLPDHAPRFRVAEHLS